MSEQGSGARGEAWRPAALRDGEEPDPRFTLANERTFLAWIRTALGMIAGAVALETFAGNRVPDAVRTPLACVLLAAAALLAGVAFRRWIRLERAMRHGEPLPVPGAAPVLAAGVVVGAVVLVVALVGAR